jgi:hypothetical protein
MSAHTLFLEIAKSDLEASRTLLSNKHYPQAVFYFEQAAENGTKSIGLWMNVVTEEECKSTDIVGHRAWKIFNLMMERFPEKLKNYFEEVMTILIKIFEESPHLEKTDILTTIQELSKNLQEIIAYLNEEVKNSQALIKYLSDRKNDELINMAFSEEELKKLHNTMITYKGEISLPTEDFLKKFSTFKEEKIKILENISLLLNKLLVDQLSKVKQLPPTAIEKMKMMLKLLATSSKLGYYMTYLISLSIIACPHAAYSRYPESKKNWNPIEKYNETTPLIKMLPFFTDEVQEAFNFLSELYTIIPQ